MSQLSFSDAEGQAKKRKVTRWEKFLNQMDQLLPWKDMERSIARYYSKSLKGRKSFPWTVMLRIHCMQLFYNLSDPAMEDTLYEVQSMRQFSGITIDTVPDETTILNFRHLLEKHNLGEKLFNKINNVSFDCLIQQICSFLMVTPGLILRVWKPSMTAPTTSDFEIRLLVSVLKRYAKPLGSPRINLQSRLGSHLKLLASLNVGLFTLALICLSC